MEVDIALVNEAEEGAPAVEAGGSSLLRRVAQQESGALEALLDAYGGLVFTLAHRMLGDSSAAEDVTQEVFVRVWGSAGTYDPLRSSERGWLMRLAHNRCIDHLRMGGARPRTAPDTDLAQFPDGTDTWHEVSRSLTAEQVRAALGRLPDEQRATIELAYFDGMTQREVAEAMSVPVGTVKGRIRLGLSHLRELIPQDGRPW